MKENLTTQGLGRTVLRDVAAQTEPHVRDDIAVLTTTLGHDSKALVPLLHEIRSRYGTVPVNAYSEIAAALGLSYAKVHSVASFYDVLEKAHGSATVAA